MEGWRPCPPSPSRAEERRCLFTATKQTSGTMSSSASGEAVFEGVDVSSLYSSGVFDRRVVKMGNLPKMLKNQVKRIHSVKVKVVKFSKT